MILLRSINGEKAAKVADYRYTSKVHLSTAHGKLSVVPKNFWFSKSFACSLVRKRS